MRKDSPYVPVEGSGKGGGIGFYAEVIPFPYFAFESGFYIRSFNLGNDVGKVIKIKQTDVVFSFGVGYGLN